ncbi:MAG: hypothetical protein ACRBBN_02150 [Methyloligellaceae bacterium]
MKKLILFIIALISIQSEVWAAEVKHLALNKKLSEIAKNAEQEWKKKRSPLAFADGAVVSSCEAYKGEKAQSTLDEAAENMKVKKDYLICDALALLGFKFHVEAGHQIRYGEIIAEKLKLDELASSPASANQKNATLNQLKPEGLFIEATSTGFKTDSWNYNIEVVAITDANGNGKPDWVLWFSDEDQEESSVSFETYIIYDVSEKAKLLTASKY